MSKKKEKKEKTKKEKPKVYMSDIRNIATANNPPIPEVSDSVDVEELFSTETSTESAILKELFNGKNIKVKTELTDYEISIIARLYLLAELTHRPKLKQVLDEFILLRVSKDRQSRKEFVEATKEQKRDVQNSFMSRMFGQQ